MKLWLVPGSSSLPALAPFRLSSAQTSLAQNQLPPHGAMTCAFDAESWREAHSSMR